MNELWESDHDTQIYLLERLERHLNESWGEEGITARLEIPLGRPSYLHVSSPEGGSEEVVVLTTHDGLFFAWGYDITVIIASAYDLEEAVRNIASALEVSV